MPAASFRLSATLSGEDVLGLRHEGEACADQAMGRRMRDVAAGECTLPPVIGTSPAIALISVDLPAPFGPSIATISPAAT